MTAPARQVARVRPGVPLEAVSLLAFAGLWEVVGLLEVSPSLPPFHAVLAALGDLVVSDRFLDALRATAMTIALALPLTVVAGLVLGVLMGAARPVEWALNPYVNLGLSLPLVSMIPVVLLVFGLGRASIVAVIVLYTLPPMIVNTFAGVRGLDPDVRAMARSFGAGPRLMLRRVVLPGAAPLVLAGVRIATGRAIKGAIIAEQVVGLIGVGGLIQRMGGAFAVEELYAAILFIGVVGMASLAALGRLERSVRQ